jgi:transcriptional antiterminator NusG
MTDDSWFIIRNTQYVTGIVGSSGQRTKPTPIPEEEIVKMVQRKDETSGFQSIPFEIGEFIQVEKGPWAGQQGEITQLKPETGQVFIEVDMFGKTTEVPVNVADIKKQ